MGEGEDRAITPVNGTRICKLSTCRTPFEPKKANQEFCCPECKKEYHKAAYLAGERAMKGVRTMHAATLDNSKRLQRIHNALKSAEGYLTTAELMRITNLPNIATYISELRKNGVPVSDAKYLGKVNGAKIFGYRLEVKAA